MEICNKCNRQIQAKDHVIKEGDKYVHGTCPERLNPNKEELKELSLEELSLAYPKLDLRNLTNLKERELKENYYKTQLSKKTNKLDGVERVSDLNRRAFKRNSKGSVITEIDLEWSNVYWLVIQFLVVLNVLMVPIAIFYLIIFSIFS